MTDPRPVGHLVSGILMLNNVMVDPETGSRTPLGDVLRRSPCGLTADAWQQIDTIPPPSDLRLCGNCARTTQGKRWTAITEGDRKATGGA